MIYFVKKTNNKESQNNNKFIDKFIKKRKNGVNKWNSIK